MSWDSETYRSINAARLAHLASLGLPLENRTVLEVGAGVGDLTHFWLERGCKVTSTDARASNVAAIQRKHPGVDAFVWDLDDAGIPSAVVDGRFDIAFCYGTLYHLEFVSSALVALAAFSSLLLVETCVSMESRVPALKWEAEDVADPWNAMRGRAARFNRAALREWLREVMPHVHCPTTQPDHPEFPLDWTAPLGDGLHRCVMIASRQPLELPTLVEGLPDRQERYRG